MNDDMKEYQIKIKEKISELVESSRLEEAKEILNQYVEIVKDDAEIYSIMGVISMMEGDINKAENVLTEGFKIKNDDFDILYNLGYLYSLKKEYHSAYKFYLLARELCKDPAIGKSVDCELLSIRDKFFLRENMDIEKVQKMRYDKKYKKILYLGWLGQGNVGDDLLFDIFKMTMFSAKENTSWNLIIDSCFPIQGYETDLCQYDLIVLGGGSLYSLGYWENICLNAERLNIPVVTWGTGLDTRDKNSIGMLIKGYEKKEMLSTNLKNSNMVIDCARLSSVRGNITKYALGNEKPEVIGDPGIIFGSLVDSYPLLEEISDFIGEDDKAVLVNWGTSFNNVAGKDEKKIELELEKAINELLKSGYKVIAYPIWVQDIQKCIELSDKIKSSNLRCIKKVYDAYGIASLIKRSRITINLKLHADILSMSLKKPFISLGYGLKCYDFCESIESKDLNVFTNEVTCEKILDKVSYIEENYIEITERFKRNIEKYYVLQYGFARKILDIIDGNYISMTRKSTVKLKKLGKNCEIFYDNMFVDEQNIEIGDNVYIGFGGYYVGSGGIKIGSGTIIAHKVEILTRNHNYDNSDLKSVPYDHRYVLKPVTIGENCWIGSHVCILPGVSIGEGSVIGMGAVVTRDVPECSVVAGNPSKVLKYRDRDVYEKLKGENKIYLQMKNSK